MKNKLLLIIALICMVVPFFTFGAFASADTVTEDGAEFIFREFHGVFQDFPNAGIYYGFDTDNDYFGYNRVNMPNVQEDILWISVPNWYYELSLSGSPFVSFAGNYALFSMRNFAQGSLTINSFSDDIYDGRLHSMCLLFAVPVGFPHDVQDGYFTSNGVDFYEDSSLVPISMSVSEPVNGLYTLTFSGSSNPTSLNFVPSVTFFSQYVVDYTYLVQFQSFELYALTWYHTPTFYNFYSNYAFDQNNPFTDFLIVLSLIDMVSVNTGYETGYREGVTAGKQQGYEEGFTAGEQQGYDLGVTAGKQQANNTVTQNSASYIQGYQDGLSAPEYSFMSLISALFDAPIRAFFGYTENGVTHPGLFSIDILGMNMGAFIASIFSLAVIITIIRLILGGKT